MHLRLALLLTLATLLTACAAREGVPRPFPGAPVPPGASAGAPAGGPEDPRAGGPEGPPLRTPEGDPTLDDRGAVVSVALGYRGVPYRFGGSDPSGFDCSGFVQYVFRQFGAMLPREVRDQFRVGQVITRSEVQPGDLVFFETVSRGASHVGLAIGDGQFVHAPSSTGVVRVERYTSGYWAQRYVGARRIPQISASH